MMARNLVHSGTVGRDDHVVFSESKQSDVDGMVSKELIDIISKLEAVSTHKHQRLVADGNDDHHERIYETDDAMTSGIDWNFSSINEKPKLVTAMEQPKPKPTMAPLDVRFDHVELYESMWSKILYSGFFRPDIVICIYFALMLRKAHSRKKKIVGEGQAYEYQKMVDDDDEEEEDEIVADELSIPEGCEETIDSGKEEGEKIVREVTIIFFIGIGSVLMLGCIILWFAMVGIDSEII